MEISLNDIRIFARHGVMPDERTLGAWFRVSLSVTTDCPNATESDELDDTVNYALMAEIVKEEMGIPSKLLEHVAGRIGKRLLADIPAIETLTVKVYKEHPPVCVECESASVALTLHRTHTPAVFPPHKAPACTC